MSFDKFDKKIKEAAENHHPNYDERAWQKMEKLLDKHLPQEKTKRRFIFFLVPVLLLGLSAVGYFIYTAKDQQTKFTKFQTGLEKVISDKTVRKNKLPSFKNENANPKDDMEKDMPKSINKNISLQLSSQHKEKYNKKIDNRKIKNTTFQIANENKKIKNDKPITINLGRYKSVNPILTFQNKIFSNILNPNENENSILISQQDKFELEKTNTNDKSKNQQSGKNEKLNKNKSEKRNYFFFSISAAPDVSYVGHGRLGRVKLLGGIGFGYHWQNGLNFYTGIFKGRKIYNAGPNDYSPPPP
ncbi:MAG: hypothetical protein KDC06_08105, partial [Chitinophagaceae bacterium]|nr:hypothetical protein [Chitinophagaceae bacterium]